MEDGRQLLFERSRKRAFDCLYSGEYNRAFGHFIATLTIDPDDEEMLNMFLYTLGMLYDQLEGQQNWAGLLTCYQESMDLLPHNPQVLHGLATVLFRMGHVETATTYFRKAYKEDPCFSPSLYCIENIRNKLVERWHFAMLNDKARNSAFADAISRAIQNGHKTVLDIGAGSGILSLMAVDAGALKVYACEKSQTMFEILQSVVKASKKEIHMINKLSLDMVIPKDITEKVDLIVTEIFDAALFGENVLETLNHAWENLLNVGEKVISEDGDVVAMTSLDNAIKPKVIPNSAVLYAVPIECERIRQDARVNTKCLEYLKLPLDVSVTTTLNWDEPYSTEKLNEVYGGFSCLSEPATITTVDFNNIQDIDKHLKGVILSSKFNCITDGTIDAVAVWFDLYLDEQSNISTAPENNSSCWEQAVFYVLPQHLDDSTNIVKQGDTIEIHFNCKGHLTLQKVVTTTSISTLPETLSVDNIVLHTLNSYSHDKILSLDLLSDSSVKIEAVVIDVSTVPILGLKCLQDGARHLTILHSIHLGSFSRLQQLCSIDEQKVHVMSYEDICQKSAEWDIVIIDPVEPNGLLKKNVFEDIALLRSMSTLNRPAVYPKKLGIFATLIESSSILQKAKVVSDENCMGYEISKFLNIYKCSIYQDLQVFTLPHHTLCDPVFLFDISLDSLMLEKDRPQTFVDLHGTVDVKISKKGTISAVPYWFNLTYNSEIVVDTLDPSSLWKQAAIVPDEEIPVEEGNIITMSWTCRNSCFFISLKKK